MAASLTFIQTIAAGAAGGALPLAAGLIRELAESRRQTNRAALEYKRARLEVVRDRAYEFIAKALSMQSRIYEARILNLSIASSANTFKDLASMSLENQLAFLDRSGPTVTRCEDIRRELQADWQKLLILVEQLESSPGALDGLHKATMDFGEILGEENQISIKAGSGQFTTKHNDERLVDIMTRINTPCKSVALAAQSELDRLHIPQSRRKPTRTP